MIWGELNDAAAEHGLGVTEAVSGTGIGGYTLGGGLGWLMAKYGRCRQPARGRTRYGGRRAHVDAVTWRSFWALRGGGGNFGVATSFMPPAPSPDDRGGLIAHRSRPRPTWAAKVADASDDLTVFAAGARAGRLRREAAGADRLPHRNAGEAERDLAPFKTWGSPLMVDVGPMPYPVMNTLLDAGFPAGSLNYWLSSFTRGLPDELIDVAVEQFATVPSAMTRILLEHFHGAVTRVGVTETAVPHRDGLEPPYPLRLDGRPTSRRVSLEPRDVRGDATALRHRPLAQLPRRRSG